MLPFIDLWGVELESYSLLYLLAFLAGAVAVRREFRRIGFGWRIYARVMTAALAGGVVGGKLYYILEVWPEFKRDPGGIIMNTAGSGWYGALILGLLAVVLSLPPRLGAGLRVLDAMAPGLVLAQAIGRVGCFMAGCCHGTASNLPWAVRFPHGLYPPRLAVHPTQLYETLIYLGVFVLLWRRRLRPSVAGSQIAWYFVLAGSGRFAVEFVRLNPPAIPGLTVPQVIAMAGVTWGVVRLLAGREWPGKQGK